jgi:hypothetical protein
MVTRKRQLSPFYIMNTPSFLLLLVCQFTSASTTEMCGKELGIRFYKQTNTHTLATWGLKSSGRNLSIFGLLI